MLVLAGGPGLAAEDSAPTGYVIGPKDLVDIRVFEVPELTVERRVSETGTVDLPIIGEVRIQGLTERQFADELRELLEEKYVQSATVAVQVREFQSRPISVVGSVRKPGPLPFSGKWTLLEVIAAAGGLSEGHGEVIHVLRRADNGLSDQIAIPVEDLFVRGDASVNIPIFANDVVNVPAMAHVTVFCLGEVNQGGALVFRESERMTVLTAIARAGGLTDRASRKILIKRRGRTGAPESLIVDYKRIIAGRDPDLDLAPDDVVMVKQSFF